MTKVAAAMRREEFSCPSCGVTLTMDQEIDEHSVDVVTFICPSCNAETTFRKNEYDADIPDNLFKRYGHNIIRDENGRYICYSCGLTSELFQTSSVNKEKEAYINAHTFGLFKRNDCE